MTIYITQADKEAQMRQRQNNPGISFGSRDYLNPDVIVTSDTTGNSTPLTPSATAAQAVTASNTPLTPTATQPVKTYKDYVGEYTSGLTAPVAPTYNYTPRDYVDPTPKVPLASGMTLTPTRAWREQYQTDEQNRQQEAEGNYSAALTKYQGDLQTYNNALNQAQNAYQYDLDNQYRYDTLDETKRNNDRQNNISLLPYSQLTKQQEINNAWDRFNAGAATADDYTLLGITQGTMPWSITKDQQTLDISRSKAASSGSGVKDYVGSGSPNDNPFKNPSGNSGGNSVINGYTLNHINNYIDRQRKRLKNADAVYSYVQNAKGLNPQFKAAVLQVLDEVQGEQ